MIIKIISNDLVIGLVNFVSIIKNYWILNYKNLTHNIKLSYPHTYTCKWVGGGRLSNLVKVKIFNFWMFFDRDRWSRNLMPKERLLPRSSISDAIEIKSGLNCIITFLDYLFVMLGSWVLGQKKGLKIIRYRLVTHQPTSQSFSFKFLTFYTSHYRIRYGNGLIISRYNWQYICIASSFNLIWRIIY